MTKKYTTELFIEKANKVHNNLYDYSKVNYKGSQIKITIIDPIYGEFEQFPNNHLRGMGNPKRGKKSLSEKLVSTKDEFISKSKLIHNNLYDYSKVEYINDKTKVCIIDPIYGEFFQTPSHHLQGKGCRKRYHESRKVSKEEFIQKLENIHGKVFDYTDMIFENMRTKIKIRHLEFGNLYIRPDSLYKKDFNLNKESGKELDHIIPLGVIYSRSKDKIDKNRPLYKFLSSDINLKAIETRINRIKSDSINYNGDIILARNIRNNYEMIFKIAKELLNIDISDIIEEDKIYMNTIE